MLWISPKRGFRRPSERIPARVIRTGLGEELAAPQRA
jgi:hypothetical protein